MIREITEQMNRELGFPQPEDSQYHVRAVWQTSVTSLVARLFRDSQLERTPETFKKTHTRYRYFRRGELRDPIVEQAERAEGGK